MASAQPVRQGRPQPWAPDRRRYTAWHATCIMQYNAQHRMQLCNVAYNCGRSRGVRPVESAQVPPCCSRRLGAQIDRRDSGGWCGRHAIARMHTCAHVCLQARTQTHRARGGERRQPRGALGPRESADLLWFRIQVRAYDRIQPATVPGRHRIQSRTRPEPPCTSSPHSRTPEGHLPCSAPTPAVPAGLRHTAAMRFASAQSARQPACVWQEKFGQFHKTSAIQVRHGPTGLARGGRWMHGLAAVCEPRDRLGTRHAGRMAG